MKSKNSTGGWARWFSKNYSKNQKFIETFSVRTCIKNLKLLLQFGSDRSCYLDNWHKLSHYCKRSFPEWSVSRSFFLIILRLITIFNRGLCSMEVLCQAIEFHSIKIDRIQHAKGSPLSYVLVKIKTLWFNSKASWICDKAVKSSAYQIQNVSVWKPKFRVRCADTYLR